MKEIGKYKIQEKIDAGGMATVFKGVQQSLNRPVAIKVLHKKFTEDSHLVERFNQESLIIARLTHPNLIHIIDRGITEKGMPYFVMDFVAGTDTAKVIKQGSHTLNQKLDIIIQVCKGLSYAHKNGVIHRDIKPANILIDSEGNAVVTDFGIAQLFDKDANENHLTKEHMVLGTLAYMSPEQKISSRNITALSDLFSLGVVIYELLTGLKPLGNFKLPSNIDTSIPKPIDDLILKCLEPEPEDRPSSADIVKDRLLELLNGAHIKASKKKAAVKGVAKMEDIFTLLDIIKEHQFGTVYLFRHRINEQLMVVKRFNLPMGGYKSAKLFTNLRHENVVDIIGVSGNESNYIIVMEYVSGGSLADRMVSPHGWKEAIKITKGILKGLSFAHRNRIIHGNLRPNNILFSESGEVKISDFGLNEHYALDPDKANWFNTCNQPRSKQADIFAVGAILYKMLTGNTPILKGNSYISHKIFINLPKKVKGLVARMLSQEPNIRFQNIDKVIAYIDDILVPKKKVYTDTIVEEKIPDLQEEVSDSASQKKSRGLFRIFFLIILLYTAFFVYLLSSDNLPEYQAIVKAIWQKLLVLMNSLISGLMQKGWF